MGKMDWKRLMSYKRLQGDVEVMDPARTPDLRDLDRIVFSAAFRRMQDKTQVFPLPLSDYVRTRLTHSIECSSVGRSLGALVGKEVIDRHGLEDLYPINFGVTTAAACLAHDIGNPPFGHSGEDAIQYWFRTSELAKKLLKQMNERQQEDFRRFEGNAQGFRILTCLQNYPKPGGLQLTCSTLGTFTKYPRESAKEKESKKPVLNLKTTKKHGFFQSELDLFEEVANDIGLIQKSDNPRCWARHPLAFLVEAADDICYRIIDFEDGFKMKRVHFKEIRDLFMLMVIDNKHRTECDSIESENDKISFLRSKVINTLIDQTSKEFLKNENSILNGSYNTPLIETIEAGPVLDEIYKKSKMIVYTAPSVLEVEAAGFEVIGGLLETFIGAATEIASPNKKVLTRGKKYLELLPERCRVPEKDTYKRVLAITDYISGMTDSYAVTLYKKIKGISLPNA